MAAMPVAALRPPQPLGAHLDHGGSVEVVASIEARRPFRGERCSKVFFTDVVRPPDETVIDYDG